MDIRKKIFLHILSTDIIFEICWKMSVQKKQNSSIYSIKIKANMEKGWISISFGPCF